MPRVPVIVLALVLSGCAPAFRDRVDVLDSSYDRAVTLAGVEVPADGHQLSPYTCFLRSSVDKKTLATEHLLYVDGIRPHAWSGATDEAAEELTFVRIGPHRQWMDDFGAIVPEEALRRRRLHGYGVKFHALDGATQIIRLTPGQIGAQLNAVDAVRAGLRR